VYLKGLIVSTKLNRRISRPLVVLLASVVGLGIWSYWPGQPNTPKLGLDLRGGTQVTLLPRVADGAITDSQLQQAVEIIRQRVNGLGVAEAEVSVQGSGDGASILVQVPGVSEQGIADVLKQTALLAFRPVLQSDAGIAATPPATGAEPIIAPVTSAANDDAFKAVYAALDCTDPANRQGGVIDDTTQYMVTCTQDGSLKYLLEPAFIQGTMVEDARAEMPQNATGWLVTLDFDGEGSTKLAEASQLLYQKVSPQNQFAIVIDGLVFSSPFFSEPIIGGSAQITGDFTLAEAKELANVLKFGALPLTLDLAEVTSISPTLGQDQLNAGILAGGLGLALVGLYLLFYYRALGVVAGVSLVVAAAMTYFIFIVMGRQIGFTLTLAGIAGAIVAIGITADSFVVYFERIRDEIRDGKGLKPAIAQGWVRARRTLLAADAVSLLAAVVLYWLSVGSVRGFAFALGLTTLIDVAVAFMFTHPVMEWLGRRKSFARGAAWTGLNPARLGAPELNSAHEPNKFAAGLGD